MALTKSLTLRGGSRSWSPSRSVQDFSWARGSPGEQGVHFVVASILTWSVMLGFADSGGEGWLAYRLVMCCCLDQAYGLHESVLYCDCDVGAGIAFA